MQELRPGSTLRGGRYRIDKVLGRGGFGITYQGETATTLSGELGNMDVRVKIAIKEFFMRDRCIRQDDGMGVTVPAAGSHQQVDKYKSKFISEARNLSNIHHPNIVNVSDVFEENQTVYYVMQYLPGGSMTDRVKREDLGRLTEDQAVRYIHQIADALTYLHNEKHICHLDVKPANILLSGDDHAILIDFGISKTFDDTGSAESSTSSVSYSNNYAPIEQYQAMKQFSPQTDLYSLGATLYYMLTGNTPPEASELFDGFPSCPYYIGTPRIWKALEQAMKPIKRERPATVEQWIRMLDGVEPIQPVAATGALHAGEASTVDEEDEATVVGSDSTDDPMGDETVVASSQPAQQQKPASRFKPKAAQQRPALMTQQQRPRNTRQEKAMSPTPQRQMGQQHAKQKKSNTMQWIIIAVVMVLSCAVGAVVYKAIVGKAEQVIEQHDPQTPTAKAMELLSTTDLTMKRIQEIERDIKHNGTDEDENNLKKRISSLKHLYLEGLQADQPQVRAIYNIYLIHKDELSKQQRELMIWFFDQPENVKQRWEQRTVKPQSLDEFRQIIEASR